MSSRHYSLGSKYWQSLNLSLLLIKETMQDCFICHSYQSVMQHCEKQKDLYHKTFFFFVIP